jgi:hypothetical protein
LWAGGGALRSHSKRGTVAPCHTHSKLINGALTPSAIRGDTRTRRVPSCRDSTRVLVGKTLARSRARVDCLLRGFLGRTWTLAHAQCPEGHQCCARADDAGVHLPGGILSHFRQVTNVTMCQGIMKRAIIVVSLCLLALPAMGQPYPPDGQYYRCRSELECKIAKALSRALTPPGGYHGATPPIPPSSLPAPPPLATPSQEEWKRAIIAEAERFCATFPSDPICHFRDQQ